ncbi:glycoside hydrolase family 76 protein [Thermothelomyces thermophilus ATCC 42464]|uniref:Glycoside hydrolase family 76 protein n=1 Tax=Thermothelomyces thermophilus (strain ATCC 42464 / BCRC 31852 / DSM 1799) TaxID=573729 RepID=G2PZN3_THET4|nr:glycoside hydrolase family 76 protein [Thermothelomyces thermophilus ATCC 42464]AEO53108.1 glycoside hydrolase family 76 protein [Thermothelomyces thermophilus ATCC 42464]
MLLTWTVVVALAMAVRAMSPRSYPPSLLRDGLSTRAGGPSIPDDIVFRDMWMALSDLQETYFERWLGTWPDGIDWTRAVMGTHVAATLRTISDELRLSEPTQDAGCVTRKEDVVGGYFADVIAYYFAEDTFAIRNQAYDDMLWVVLAWLESIRFIDEHSRVVASGSSCSTESGAWPGAETWYGSRWIPAFAHRARIFWELAAKGWDTKLCGGGMIWNPRLMPYKNAITNQLFISASISMYLHFPGDTNSSPFSAGVGSALAGGVGTADWPPHDPIYGKAARDAHDWLASSNMTNAQGLYADGFHVSGQSTGSNNTRCDDRDEMVYTYNQGVLLSGLMGLYRATGQERYLREGHTLIRNVISATGYDLEQDKPVDPIHPDRVPPWRGLGRVGVLEEACDASGTCSQDAQTFKGIWMHHFAAFCAPAALRFTGSDSLGSQRPQPHGEAGAGAGAGTIRARHERECRRYIPWLRHNVRAATGTRDENGLFGMWWTAGLLTLTSGEAIEAAGDLHPLPPGGDGGEVVDYRNTGVPLDPKWTRAAGDGWSPAVPVPDAKRTGQAPLGHGQGVVVGGGSGSGEVKRAGSEKRAEALEESGAYDPNLRGRGRTVETQGGGLAVLRALWVVSRLEG